MGRYDIFISYRRDGGEQSAKAIFDALRGRGYNVFLDIETLRSGAFNTKLYSVIEECGDVIVVLSPQALDRCVNDDDWVRLEVAHALGKGKNVVPVMLRGFSFPDTLPADINELRFQNGLQASVEFFDAFIEKLSSFIKSKPGLIGRFKSLLSGRNILIAVLCCIIIAAGILIVPKLLGSGQNASYPATREEKNEVNRLISYIEENMSVADMILDEANQALSACDDYLVNASPDTYGILSTRLTQAEKNITGYSKSDSAPQESLISDLADSEIKTGDVEAVAKYSGILSESYNGTIESLAFAMDPDIPLDNATRKKIIEINRQLLRTQADGILVEMCILLQPVDESALRDFRVEFLPTLNSFSDSLQLWSHDETMLKSQETNIFSQQDKLMGEYSSLVGDMNYDTLTAEQDLIDLYKQLGMTEEEAKAEVDKYLGTVTDINNKKEEADQLKNELETLKQELRDQCAPQETDDPYLVWGKALKLMSAKMYDDAVSVFQFYMIQMKDDDKNAAVYVPCVISFIRQISVTGIDYGAVVVGYDPEKPHDIYKIGDIIVAFNGNPCRNANDYIDLRKQVPEGMEYKVTLLRPDDSGALRLTDVTIPAGQPGIYMMDLALPQE